MNAVDEDFETRLRQRLREAADEAPTFRGLDARLSPEAATGATGSAPRRRAHRWLAAAAAVLVLAGAGGTWWATHPTSGGGTGDGDGGAASCAAMLKLDGRTYYGWGDLTRTPRVVDRLGRATMPACGDDSPARQIRPFALPGVPVDTAVFAEGTVWLNRTLPEMRKGLPAALRDLTRPVQCHGNAPAVMTGSMNDISPMPSDDDLRMRPPYTVTVVATTGEGLSLDRYRSVVVRLRITQDTTGVDPAVLQAALWDGKPVSARWHCDGTAFVADSLRLNR